MIWCSNSLCSYVQLQPYLMFWSQSYNKSWGSILLTESSSNSSLPEESADYVTQAAINNTCKLLLKKEDHLFQGMLWTYKDHLLFLQQRFFILLFLPCLEWHWPYTHPSNFWRGEMTNIDASWGAIMNQLNIHLHIQTLSPNYKETLFRFPPYILDSI